MSRYRRDDSDESDRRPKAGGGNSVALWLLVGIGAAILLLCGGVTTVGYVMLARFNQAARRAMPTAPPKKTYTRDALKTMLMGKSKEEVFDLLGKPEYTSDPDAGHYWRYEDVAVDSVNGKVDAFLYVRFNAFNVVAGVDF